MEETERNFWSEFVYARVLDGFCKILETEAARNKGLIETIGKDKADFGLKARDSRIRLQRMRMLAIMRKVTGTFTTFLYAKTKDRSLRKLILETHAPAKTFKTYEDEIIQRLAKFSPEVHAEERHIWPGPLSIQQTVSLFVRTCVRVHCERPDLSANNVAYQVARSVAAPALAYLAYLSSQKANGDYAYSAIRDMSAGHNLPKKEPTNADELRWYLFLAAISSAMNDSKEIELTAKEYMGFYGDVLSLLEEHTRNPQGGRLWQSLGMLSSTSPASADTLLFQILRQFDLTDGREHGKVQTTQSRIVCASIRYEIVRNAIFDEELRLAVMDQPAKVIQTVNKSLALDSKDRPVAIEQLELAFLISRRALLPSNYQPSADITEETEFAKLAERLLAHNCNSCHEDIRRIARRYRAGLITNPRFAKDAHILGKMSVAIDEYNAVTTAGKTLLSKLFEGRRAWMQLLAGKSNDESTVHRFYAQAAHELFQSQSNYDPVTTLRNQHDESIDSEAPMWLLPELATLVRLGDDLSRTESYGSSFADQIRERDEEKLDAAATSLLRIGERQFGVYLNHRSEDLRVKQGMLLASKLLR